MPPVDASLTFAHPDLGVALVDMAPDRAADPVERLRRRLEALETRPTFAAELPIVYLPLTSADLWRLNIILDSAFASRAPLPREEGGWVDVVQQALLPESFPRPVEQPEPGTTASIDLAAEAKQRRSLRPWMLSGVAAALLAGVAAFYVLDPPGQQASLPQPGGQTEPAPPAVPDEPAVAAAPPIRADVVQPRPAAPDQRPAPAQQAGGAPPPRGASVPPRPPETVFGPRRITVHSTAAKRDVAEALLRSAASADDTVEFRTLRTTLNFASVRYFHERDKAAAEQLAKRLGPTWRVQDLTRYRPSPRLGSLEVWLPRYFRAD
ncbi:hypothetical protein MHZ93_07475 [Roseomonas sp. ACRSG]|nr:hypothetical protein [Roseomonas sp. ACRSG]